MGLLETDSCVAVLEVLALRFGGFLVGNTVIDLFSGFVTTSHLFNLGERETDVSYFIYTILKSIRVHHWHYYKPKYLGFCVLDY